VTAVAEAVRFYVDESALGIGKTLTAARKDVIHVGHPLIPECPLGALDEDWMPAVAARGLVAIGRDKHIRTRPHERAAIRDTGLRVFRIGGRKDQSTWEWLGRFVRYWGRMEQIMADRPAVVSQGWCK
jgi:PIN like domain